MLIVFEGIDGSGKTTLSNRVARALAERGTSVRHVREGGKLASATAEAIRQLARDQRHAALSPVAELLLYAARDAQQLDEAMQPALSQADVVIADCYAYTALVMASAGRGLPAELARAVIDAVTRGVIPELVILVDVEPHIARARRRIGKLAEPGSRPASRKGLSGEGLMVRLREGYRALAERAPERWIVVDNSDADLDTTVTALVEAIETLRAGGGVAGARTRLAARVPRREPVHVVPDPEAAREAFLAWVDRRMVNEPALAAYFLGGLAGPDYDQRRLALARVVPTLVADGLRGLDDAVSWELRLDLLTEAPAEVARSLADDAGRSTSAWTLREQLVLAAPAEVAHSLRGFTSPRAWALRTRLEHAAPLAVMGSLAGDDSERAWRWRMTWLSALGGDAALAEPARARAVCQSITGLGGAQAWRWRERALPAAPAAALSSLAQLSDERSWRWRREWLARAPRPVLRSLDGLDEEHAHDLRERALDCAPEAVSSLYGLDSPRARALREAAATRWPVAVAKSLAGLLVHTPRAQALFCRLLTLFPGHVGLWKHAGAAALPARVPAPLRQASRA